MPSDASRQLATGYTNARFQRAYWVTPKLDAFVMARNHMSWEAIYQEWLDTHPNDPAPASSEKLRAHYRGRVTPKRISRPNPKVDAPGVRTCLSCRKPFRSEGKHNWMCAPCKKG